MPPTNPVEEIYFSGIERVCKAIGYEAAFKALFREYESLADATLRQAFQIDGALMTDIAEIIKEYPNWSARFLETDGEVEIKLASQGGSTQEETEEIKRRVDAAFAARNKIPGVVPAAAFVGTISVSEKPEEG